MKKTGVLVSSVGSTAAISVIKGLRKQEEFDVFIVGTDTNEEHDIAGSKFCDKFYKVPPAAEEENYMDLLVNIIKTESIDLLIPISDIELEVIARNRNSVEKLTYLLLSSYDSVMKCNDKLKTYEFFKSQGIPTFNTAILENYVDITDVMNDRNIDFPFIVKPRKGVGSQDVYEIQNEGDFFLMKRVSDAVIQEKGRGQEYTIDVFCNGEKLVSAVPRRRIETKAGISYKGQTQKDDRLTYYAKKITEELKIKGPANIQCFKNSNNDVKFFEINPRFSGGLPLTMAAGVNTPLFALKMALMEELDVVKDFKIVKMCRYWEEVFYYEN